MIREEKFLISKRPYAVDLASLETHTQEPEDGGLRNRLHHVRFDAVWFRRRRSVTVAVIGYLWDYQRDPKPESAQDALGRHDDGRYGGLWIARWDGDSYVSEIPQSPEAMAEHLAILRPMLDNYPAVPPGYDGWWRF